MAKWLLVVFLLSKNGAGAFPYLKTLTFSLPSQGKKISKVVYGNSEFGYFQSDQFFVDNQKITFTLVPPGFGTSIHFAAVFVSQGVEQHQCLGKVVFDEPPSEVEVPHPTAKIRGRLNAPYYLLNGDDYKRSFVYVLNRKGQMVWLLVPHQLAPTVDKKRIPIVVQPRPRGEYAILTGNYFERINYKGETLGVLDAEKAKIPFQMHHEMLFENESTMLVPGNSFHVYRKRWWHPLGKTFKGSPIQRVNLKTGTAEVLWDYLKDNNPYSMSDAYGDASDFLHLNSIQKVSDKGYLVSVRALSKLFFLNPEFQILWTVGLSDGNTYRTAGTSAAFYFQHHATMLSDESILLFDNHRKKSRIIQIRLNDSDHVAELVKEYSPSPAVNSTYCGSAYLWGMENLYGLFPTYNHKPNSPTVLAQFDTRTQKETGRLEVEFGYKGAAYRGIPLSAIGEEQFLGFKQLWRCE